MVVRRTHRLPGVFAVEVSQNKKLGVCSATYAAQVTCPPDCPFLGNGCYDEWGHAWIHTRRLNAEAKRLRLSPIEVAENEAAVVRSLSGCLDLRLHVVGDCQTTEAADVVSLAGSKHRRKRRRDVWTYTHAWAEVPREAWRDVSVLASCETAEQVRQAWSLGYAAAVTLPRFRQRKLYLDAGLKVLPCPEQATGDKDCSSCRLCFSDAKLLDKGVVIAFAAHGGGKKRMPLPMALGES